MATFGMSLGSLPSAFAKRPADLRPVWQGGVVNEWNPNVSFLSDLAFDQDSDTLFADELMDAEAAQRIYQKYEALSSDYEDRQNRGLSNPWASQSQSGKMTQLRQEALGEIRRFQNKKQLNKLRSAIERDEKLKKPVTVAVAVAGIVTGAPYRTSIGESAHVTVAANVPYQTSYIQLDTPIVNGVFTAVGDRNAGNSVTLPPPDWVSRDERYRLSLSRSFPVWGLGSGLAYGGSSNTLKATLSKELATNLICSLNSEKSLDQDASLPKKSGESVMLNYELHF